MKHILYTGLLCLVFSTVSAQALRNWNALTQRANNLKKLHSQFIMVRNNSDQSLVFNFQFSQPDFNNKDGAKTIRWDDYLNPYADVNVNQSYILSNKKPTIYLPGYQSKTSVKEVMGSLLYNALYIYSTYDIQRRF